MPEIRMPRLSDSMEEGTILRWLKAEGEQVARDEELVEIETDKASMVYESDVAGTLTIVAAEGDTVALGEVIAVVGDPASSEAAPVEPAPAAARRGAAAQAAAPAAAAPAPAPAAATPAAPAPAGGKPGGASPVARRLAGRLGIDVATISGTGPRGRVMKADVRAAHERGTAAQAPVPEAPAPAAAAAAAAPVAAAPSADGAKGPVSVEELSRIQQLIARRMAESKATVPEFTLTADVDMQECVALRGQLKALAGERPAPSFNDMVVKACALALREHPRANGSYRDGRFELHGRVNVGVAVAARDALVVPVVADADQKSLGALAAETRRLAEAVRANAVTPAELAGGTFTVSNLGMFGIDHFTAVINAPQAAILAVGALKPRPVVRDGELVARPTMTITLTCDHRILYGADAAAFLGRIRDLLEQPLGIAL